MCTLKYVACARDDDKTDSRAGEGKGAANGNDEGEPPPALPGAKDDAADAEGEEADAWDISDILFAFAMLVLSWLLVFGAVIPVLGVMSSMLDF